MALKINTGKISRAQKVVIYGCEGIGKTTLASCFPEPLFIDTEGGTAHLDVSRLEGITTWQALLDTVKEVASTQGICKTLVIDTADWAEASCIKSLCEKNGWKSIESPGFGKGYVYIGEEFGKLLRLCDDVIASGMNVVITAHAKMRKFEQPDEMGAYDRWEMKLTRNVYSLIKEWADMILFCNYKTMVMTEGSGSSEKKKVVGGDRVMYTSHHACWDAKNRHGLPPELPMGYESIAKCFEGPEAPFDVLKRMMDDAGITAEQVEQVASARGQLKADESFDTMKMATIKWCIKYFDNIKNMIEEAK